jgi:pimeloyl-ACP methyl ester carboxylesterase
MTAITLHDGRILAYAEYGDPGGKPVFFFHGTPGSRLFTPPGDGTTRQGVRLICTDRPGYGASTFQRGRRLLDWPQDICELADALGMDKFSIVGHSGGGPYTLACAYALPDRVRSAATLSGAGPVDTPGVSEGMISLNSFGIKYGRYIPWPLFFGITWFAYRQRCADPAKFMQSEIGKRPPADDAIFGNPEVFDLCLRTEREAFRNGLHAMAWDAHLITCPWDFPLEKIMPVVHIWHGSADNVTSLNMARYMAGKIPNSRLNICEDEGHMLLIPHWEEVLSALIA